MKTDTLEKVIFYAEDFDGSGQYVILNREDHYKDTGYMTTLMFKICYGLDNSILLVAMTDGMVMRQFKSSERLKENKQELCQYLNEENYRPAYHEELIRLALYQHRRCG